ncbi:hypothetical protein [Aeromonas media]|uniref:hypothetical protein n=1 Tax=Aeromonas media TaxID=651 RepID=UPI0013A6D226|nr:hypothetical protein [Aeromonas media]
MKKIKKMLMNNRCLHKLYYSSGPISLALQKVKGYIYPEIKIDISKHFNEINYVISCLNLNAFPMFGTLLCYYRDNDVRNTDDYDYAIIDLNAVIDNVLMHLRPLGFTLKSLSYVCIDGQDRLVELSFDYKGIRVDIFDLSYESNRIVHRCPNFRTEKPKLLFFKKGITKTLYKSFFEVKYESFSLDWDPRIGLNIPSSAYIEDIFLRHYGSDWNVPKKENFIDFKHYCFVENTSYCLLGNDADLFLHLKSSGLCKL